MGAGTSSAEPQLFLCGNPEDLSGTSQRPIFTKFGHETYFGPVDKSGKTFSKIFTLRVICPKNLKSERYCLLHVVVQGSRSFRGRRLFSTTYGCGATVRQSCPIFGFFLFSLYKTPKTYLPVTSLQPTACRSYIAE